MLLALMFRLTHKLCIALGNTLLDCPSSAQTIRLGNLLIVIIRLNVRVEV
jgi:hypothetical protein